MNKVSKALAGGVGAFVTTFGAQSASSNLPVWVQLLASASASVVGFYVVYRAPKNTEGS